jgi:hypothetical protein
MVRTSLQRSRKAQVRALCRWTPLCCSPLPRQDRHRGRAPPTTCAFTIRLLISYLVITLRGEESCCHGTRVLTWSGRAVPNARVTDTAQSATSSGRQQPSANTATSVATAPPASADHIGTSISTSAARARSSISARPATQRVLWSPSGHSLQRVLTQVCVQADLSRCLTCCWVPGPPLGSFVSFKGIQSGFEQLWNIRGRISRGTSDCSAALDHSRPSTPCSLKA